MAYFLCRLIPPRPTFPQDMTEAEADVMKQHVAYWTDLSGKGVAVVFGPVLDPKGVWGVAIVETEDETATRKLGGNDPVIQAGIGFTFEFFPMSQAVLRS